MRDKLDWLISDILCWVMSYSEVCFVHNGIARHTTFEPKLMQIWRKR
jgi:hypothetical protein